MSYNVSCLKEKPMANAAEKDQKLYGWATYRNGQENHMEI